MEAVQAAVRDINAQNLRRVAPADAGIAFEPKTLLALLTYCYARRIYSSEDVEAVLRKDCGFRELCRNEFPGADLLRRFRRQNHESLQHCLQETLRFSHPVSSSDLAHSSDAHLAEEADTRIMTAVLMDAPE
jgi:transposase